MALETLPNELLLAIVSEVDTSALPPLAAVSHDFHHRAVTRLYRRVYFVEDGEPESHVGCGFVSDQAAYRNTTPDSGSRIFDLARFHYTIIYSPLLRREIREVSFCWQSPSEGEVGFTIQDLVGLLAPTAKFVHLSPPPIIGHTFIEYPVTSLQIDTAQLETVVLPDAEDEGPRPVASAHTAGVPSSPSVELRRLHAVFASPTLDRLWLEEVGGIGFDMARVPAWAGSSRLTYLCLQSLSKLGPDLRELLSWPAALRVFDISRDRLWTPLNENLGELYLIEALWPQRHSLEAALLSFPYWFNISDAAAAGYDFREFTRLRTLSISADAFANSSRLYRPEAMEDALRYLPRQLATLQIHMDIFQHGLWFERRNLGCTWLRQLAVAKITSLPRLRRVVLWQDSNTRVRSPLLDYQYALPDWDPVKTGMDEAGIQFLVTTGRISPI